MDFGDVFEHATRRIRREYDRLGHSLGWRFLYTPRRTLTASAALMLVGYNPGGREYEAPRPSVEDGNAFRVEHWPGNGPTHQRRVVRLLTEVGSVAAPSTPPDEFVDGTLTVNFCPFRSPSAEALHRKEESLGFSETLWSEIFTSVRPRAVVANGKDVARLFEKPLASVGFHVVETASFDTGWGSYTYHVTSLRNGDSTIRLFGLPHLSRFDIRGADNRAALACRIGSE
jgi:hypothetical protein